MIYYIDNVDVGPIHFETQLKEDLSKLFGTKTEYLLQELTMEAIHHMSMTFEEVLVGGRKYQILVHPIVYVEKPIPYRINEPIPNIPMSPTINPNPNPWWDPNKGVWMETITTATGPVKYNNVSDSTSTSVMTREEYELNRLVDKVVK